MNVGISSSYMTFQARRLLKWDTYDDRMELVLRANIAVYEAHFLSQKRQERASATIIALARKIIDQLVTTMIGDTNKWLIK